MNPDNPTTSGSLSPRGERQAGKRRWLRTLVGILMALVAFFFMGRSLYKNWTQVKEYFATLHFHWAVIPFAFVSYGLAVITAMYGWQRILRHFWERLDFWHTARIMAYSQFGKYLPGKVWAVLGRVYMARERGIDSRHSAVSVIVETAFMLITALLLFAFSLLFYRGLPILAYLLLLLIPVSLVLVYPPVFRRIVNFLLVRAKLEPIEFHLSLSGGLGLLLLYIVCWVFQGIGFYLLTISLYPLPVRDLLIFPGAFAISWVIGLIVIWAPGGLGIREGLFALLLNPLMSSSMNVVVGLLSRLWVTLSEVLVFLVILVIGRFRGNADTSAARPDQAGREET